MRRRNAEVVSLRNEIDELKLVIERHNENETERIRASEREAKVSS